MLRFAFMAIGFLICAAIMLALLVAAMVTLVLAAAVGMPLYLMARPYLKRHGITGKNRPSPVERLQTLFAEGKIDLFEFERRVAQLVRIEH